MTEPAPNAPTGEPQGQPTGQAPGQGDPNANPNPAPANDDWYRNEAFAFSDEQVGFIQNKGWSEGPQQILSDYQNLEKFHGVPADQLLKLPKDIGEEGALNDVYTRLGRPEAADQYGEAPLPEGLPDGFQIDEGRVKWADGIAHKMGLNKAQRNALIAETATYEAGVMAESHEAERLEGAAQLAELKTELGASFEEQSELGRRVVRGFTPKGADPTETLNAIEGAIGTANMIKFFGSIGQAVGQEHSIHTGDDGARPFGQTPEQAKDDLGVLKTEIKADSERLAQYNLGKGPDYEKVQKLQRAAYS